MTAIDTNILIDLLVDSMPDHEKSLSGIKNIDDQPCTTQTNIGECLRLLTHPRVFPKPMKIGDAVSLLNDLLTFFRIRVLEESYDWWLELASLEDDVPGLKGNEVFDARIALCLRSNNVKRIFTRDSDFKKYSFLKVITTLK